MSDHGDVVAAVKADLVARGVDLSGVKAFEITKRVAWALRAEGAGVYFKNYGNMTPDGYAVDIIEYPDGSYVDILGDAGGANTPAWGIAPDKLDPGKYRPAFDPGDTPAPQPQPEPQPPAPSVDVQAIVNDAVARINAHSDENTAKVIDAITKLRNDALAPVKQYGTAAVAAQGGSWLSGLFGGKK